MPKILAWQVSCQLYGVRFSKENPLGKAKLAPGKATQASRGYVRKWKMEKEKEKKKGKRKKINRQMGEKNENKIKNKNKKVGFIDSHAC